MEYMHLQILKRLIRNRHFNTHRERKSYSIAQKIISGYEDELKVQHEEYKSEEGELDDLNENLVWVDWVEKFADNIKSEKTSCKTRR